MPLIHRAMLPILALLCTLAFQPGSADAREMEPGALPPLQDGEGYLAVIVDTDTQVIRLHLNRLGKLLGGERVDGFAAGRSVRILRLPAGEYRWSRVDAAPTLHIGQIANLAAALALLGKQQFQIDKLEASLPFVVAPGKLNYAGDLHLRFRNGMLSLAMPNRSERALALIEAAHPGSTSLAWHYTGDLHDHYATVRGDRPPIAISGCPEDSAWLPNGSPGGGELFRREEIERLELSPEGDLILESAYRNGQYQVNIIEPATGDVLVLYQGVPAIDGANWAGRRQVVVELRSRSGVTGTHLFRFGDGPLHGQQATRHTFPATGWVMDPLPGDEKHLLFATHRPAHRDPLQVFRIEISRRTLSAGQFEARNRIDKNIRGDIAWLADAAGQLRLAMVDGDDGRLLVYRHDARSDFQTLRKIELETLFAPESIEADGTILALSNEGRDQVELVRLDPADPSRLVTVHAVPGIDLDSVERSGTDGRVIGVRYYSDGVAQSHFFDPSVPAWLQHLEETFPGRHAEVVDIDTTHGLAIVAIGHDTRPTSYYHFTVATGKAVDIGSGAPWLEGHRFVGRQAITVTGTDGNIQALLAIPETTGPHPLLVMPHGGPLFVQDVLRFDRNVQYWATRGFAVLQVNFRGSYGFGVRHLLAGFAGFGRQIEDDIIAAVDHVLASENRLDGTRVCAIGSSYGGYSSLMLALRDPERIRCAVSINGPTDLPLLFMSSDWNSSDDAQEAMQRVVGNPTDPDLRLRSPLYRSADFKVPVLLVHGVDDRRVDFEHAARLATRLAAEDKSIEIVRVDDMGHGAETVGQQLCVMGRAEQFIRSRLGSSTAPIPARP